MRKPGMRVGAIFGTRQSTGVLEYFGVGVYVGDEVPVGAVGFLADHAVELSIPNPRINLDTGETVFGCECWWCPEEQFSEILASTTKTKLVTVAEVRAAYRATHDLAPSEASEPSRG